MPAVMGVDEVLQQTLGEAIAGTRALTLPPVFQGLPGTAHGGTVVALFDAVARVDGVREVAARYVKRVPVASPLRLAVTAAGGVTACRVLDPTGAVLVEGRVTGFSAAGPAPAHDPRPADASSGRDDGAGHEPTVSGPARPGMPGPGGIRPLPVSAGCFVCGVDNELGLQARLVFDDTAVRSTWEPRLPFRRVDASVAPVALASLLDEAAFWMGALATGEAGMTTELAVTLHRPAAAASAVMIVGDRTRARPKPGDARYLETTLVAFDDAGSMLATAHITFVAVRGAARRLAAGMLRMNSVDVLRRVFPAYVTDA